jgi:PAS domain S-box-containing protein
MAGHIYHTKEEKITKSNVNAGTASPACDLKDAVLQTQALQPVEIEVCSDQTEALPADTSTPLYSSRIINTYIEIMEKFYPVVDIDAVLRKSEITRHEVEDSGHWFTQHQVDSFHETLVAKTGNPNIAREAGRFTVSSKRVGAAKQYALGAISLVSIYMKTGKLAEAISRGAVMTTQKLGSNKVEIVARPTPGTIEKPYQCENRIGTLEGVAKLVTKKFAEIEHLACIHKGDDCCRYILTWEKTTALIWKRISNFMPLAGLLICLMSFPFIAGQASIALGLSWASLCLIFFLYAAHLEKKDLVQTIETQGNAAKDLLDEMNLRHSNALLVQEIGQAISKILNESRIMDTVVAVVQKHLYFNRGMIMLADRTQSRLKFISGFGYSREQEKILLDTEFHLDEPDSRGHFVRSFREQKPFLVRDVADIEKDLSTRSREFIRQMGVQSFICVPIVYEEESLGVLVVENIRSRNHLAQSEISLLMGVASQTATAIINARSFKKIQESERQYRLLADNISDVIWIIDLSLAKFSYVSPSVERIQGFTPEELMKLDLQDTLTPPSFEIARKAISEELVKEKNRLPDPYRSRTLELEQYHKDGSTIWVEVTASFLHDNAGNVVSILGASREITERKEAEEENKKLETRLQQAQKMEAIGTLAGGIAHDFNNILTAVLGYTELAIDDAENGTLLHKNLKEVIIAGNRAKDLVKQILAFSRRADQELKPVRVESIVKEAVKLIRSSLPSTIEIELNLASNSATLADPTQIHQVLMNLCTNAHHAMSDSGGVLTVSLCDVTIDSGFESRKLDLTTGGYLYLQVKDTGHGMPEAVRARIFDPFFTTKERDKGTGMGLSVVHGIVKSHGGAITVHSQPGKGTSFAIYFPIIRSEVKTPAETGTSPPTGDERILFVDDEKTLVDLGRQMLERLGYRVQCRTSSIEAFELFKSRPDRFDLVITDMTMPNMTGDKLTRQIMSIRSDIPVILCTGFSEQISEESAKEMGIREFILKPLVMDNLARTVRSALDRFPSSQNTK